MVCREEDEDDEVQMGPLGAGAGEQARKLAAQAVIELTDKLTRSEQENAALRQRLHSSRQLSKVQPRASIRPSPMRLFYAVSEGIR